MRSQELRKTIPSETQSLPPLEVLILERIHEVLKQTSAISQPTLAEATFESIREKYIDILYAHLEQLEKMVAEETLEFETIDPLSVESPAFTPDRWRGEKKELAIELATKEGTLKVVLMEVYQKDNEVKLDIKSDGITIIRRESARHSRVQPVLKYHTVILFKGDIICYSYFQNNKKGTRKFYFDVSEGELVPAQKNELDF